MCSNSLRVSSATGTSWFLPNVLGSRTAGTSVVLPSGRSKWARCRCKGDTDFEGSLTRSEAASSIDDVAVCSNFWLASCCSNRAKR